MPIEFKHIEMVGRLAKDEEIKGFEDYGRTAVFINKPGDIQYKIKSLSTKNDVAEEQFTGYISSIRNLEFVDDQYSAPEDRVKAFSDFYSKSLFVFSHKIDSMGNVKVDVADVLTRPLVIDENTKFVAIPYFSGKTQCDKISSCLLFSIIRKGANNFKKNYNAVQFLTGLHRKFFAIFASKKRHGLVSLFGSENRKGILVPQGFGRCYICCFVTRENRVTFCIGS